MFEYDGLPIARCEFGVDAFRFGDDQLRVFLKFFDTSPCGRCDLQKGEFFAVLRMRVEKELDTLESLGNSLDVIEAVDTEREVLGTDTEILKHAPIHRRIRFSITGKCNRNRERFDAGLMSAAERGESFVVDARLDLTRDRLHKVVAVLLRMEPDEVSPEHALEELFAPRTNCELSRRRPGDVPKDAYLRVGTTFLDNGGEKGEMIILHEDNWPFDMSYLFEQ